MTFLFRSSLSISLSSFPCIQILKQIVNTRYWQESRPYHAKMTIKEGLLYIIVVRACLLTQHFPPPPGIHGDVYH